mmetsp:Transcript_13910/g.18506  ORF Transcript_13910/g.18506 Transcript_13910/m.18506 type:complete len:98 (+) Transcript_13910:132-425(+)
MKSNLLPPYLDPSKVLLVVGRGRGLSSDIEYCCDGGGSSGVLSQDDVLGKWGDDGAGDSSGVLSDNIILLVDAWVESDFMVDICAVKFPFPEVFFPP